MIINIFDYKNYKPYLGNRLKELSKKERGTKQRAANFIGCQASFLSQVLYGKPDLTLDQAYRFNQFFHHDKIESRFFMLLVELSRASTKELKEYYKEQMQEVHNTRFDLKKRLRETDEISEPAMNKYYSTWFYSAIHIALAIPELQDAHEISRKFNLPIEIVLSVIQFLETEGLIEKEKNHYVFTKMRIHLDRNSDFIQRHHINWRSQALQSVEKNLKDDLHFSTVFAVSKSDVDRIKDIFVQAIENSRTIIRPSRSEDLCALTIDLFKL